MSFALPLALLSLVAVVALLLLALREKKTYALRLAKLGDVPLLIKLVKNAAPQRRFAKHLLAIAGFACLCIAMAGPRFGSATEVLPRRGLDVVFAVDVSGSMRARDVLPDRLERVKAEIGLFLPELSDNRVGLIAFAGTAFVQCPLTADMAAVDMFLRALDPTEVLQGGTALEDALVVARNLFLAEVEADNETQKAGRVLVILTDGEDHEGGAQEASAKLKELGVELIVIGIGDSVGEPIPLVDDLGRVVSYKKDKSRQTVMTRLNAGLLKEVAKSAEGTFITGADETDLGLSIVKEKVSTLEKREFESRVKKVEIDRARWPLSLSFIFFLAAVILPDHRRESKAKGDAS